MYIHFHILATDSVPQTSRQRLSVPATRTELQWHSQWNVARMCNPRFDWLNRIENLPPAPAAAQKEDNENKPGINSSPPLDSFESCLCQRSFLSIPRLNHSTTLDRFLWPTFPREPLHHRQHPPQPPLHPREETKFRKFRPLTIWNYYEQDPTAKKICDCCIVIGEQGKPTELTLVNWSRNPTNCERRNNT